MHWGIYLLREDLQEARQEIRALRKELHEKSAMTDPQRLASRNYRIDAQSQALIDRTDKLKIGVMLSSMIAIKAMTVSAIIYFMQLYLPPS